MNPIKFFKSVIEEAQKVEWLNRKDLYKYSKIVIGYIIIATSTIALLDLGFITIRTLITDNILF